MKSIISLLLLFFFHFVVSSPCRAQLYDYPLKCVTGNEIIHKETIFGCTLELMSHNDYCSIAILDKNNNKMFGHTSRGIEVYTGSAIDPDEATFAVVQSTDEENELSVISLSYEPGLLQTLKNKYGFWLQDNFDDGLLHICTSDGSFYGDPEIADIYHSDLIAPEVVFELRGKKLVDVTPKFKKYFEKSIKRDKAAITEDEKTNFLNGKIRDDFRKNQIKGYVLNIIRLYLYTEQEDKAKTTLETMWPAADRQRIWDWSIKHRSEGVLKQLANS